MDFMDFLTKCRHSAQDRIHLHNPLEDAQRVPRQTPALAFVAATLRRMGIVVRQFRARGRGEDRLPALGSQELPCLEIAHPRAALRQPNGDVNGNDLRLLVLGE